MVLAAIMGFVSTCCSSYIEFTGAFRDGDNLTAYIDRWYAGGMLPMVTNPYHIIVIEKVPNVRFSDPLFDLDWFPPFGSIRIEYGNAWTRSRSVTLDMTYFDDMSGVSRVRYSNDGVFDSELWELPTSTKSWTLTDGDGMKTVYYQIKDFADNTFTTSDSIGLDTTPPTGSILINGGDLWARHRSVELTLNYTDLTSGVYRVRYGWDGTWDSEPWEYPTPTKGWILPEGDGAKTVFYQIWDNAFWESITYSDDILLDTEPPTGSVIINDGDSMTPSTSVVLALTYSDAVSGASEVRYSNDGFWDTEPWELPATSKDWTLKPGDGLKKVYYQIRDSAGHLSITYSDSIGLDTNLPYGTLTINNGDEWTTTKTVELTSTYIDDFSGVTHVRYSNDGLWDTEPWETPSTTRSWTLTTGDGAKTVWYQIRDGAGNIYGTSDDISLDTIKPDAVIEDPLPGFVSSATSFRITWIGSDPSGSGIEFFDLQYRVGATGSWTDWLTSTKLTTATFGPTSPIIVEDRQTYYFRIRARDIAGNVEDYRGADGDTNVKVDLTITDTTPPTITNPYPPDDSTVTGRHPRISAEYYDSSGIDLSSVTLRVDGYDVTPSSTVTMTAVYYKPAIPLSDGDHHIRLEVEDRSTYRNKATELWSFSVNTSAPDTTPPTIFNLRPSDGSAIEDETPMISADYADTSGIDVGSVVLVVDGVDVTPLAIIAEDGVTYEPASGISTGHHQVAVEVRDGSANRNKATKVWAFTVIDQELDLDNDGLTDHWEITHFGNLNIGAADDPDGDELVNLLEHHLGTDPLDPDTDGDGINDRDDSRPLEPMTIGRSIFVDPLFWSAFVLIIASLALVVFLRLRSRRRKGKEPLQ
jgi:hypothetical protein